VRRPGTDVRCAGRALRLRALTIVNEECGMWALQPLFRIFRPVLRLASSTAPRADSG
jgi:hypothetical protein